MIFYNENENNNYILKQCISKRNYLKNTLNLQKQKRSILLTCMNKISFEIDRLVDVDNVSILFELLENIKVSLNFSEFNIDKITKLEKYLAELQPILSNTVDTSDNEVTYNSISENECDSDIDNLYELIDRFNEKYSSIEKKLIENDNAINTFLLSFVEKCTFEIPDSLTSKSDNTTNSNEFTEIF